MATIDQLEKALRNADAAGNVEAAKVFAQEIIKARNARQTTASMALNAVDEVGSNLVGGAVRGAGSIGATLLAPVDAIARQMGATGDNILGLGRTDRREAMDEGLKTLLNANPESATYGAGKLGSEIAGTAGVGGALAKGVGLVSQSPKALAAIEALKTAGFRTGVNPQGLAQKIGDVALRSGAGAAVGGASAMAVDPEEWKTGAAIGAVLPPALKAIGKGVALPVGAAARMVSDSAAEKAAVRKLADVVKGPADIEALTATRKIPQSTAAVLQNPDVAILEQASRLRGPGPWTEFDQNRSRAIWDRVKQATDEASDVSSRAAARSKNWNQNWAAAETAVDPAIFSNKINDLSSNIELALRSKEAANPQVRSALQELQNNIANFGPDFSPGHLQVLRAEFNGKVPFSPPNALKAAPRDSPAIVSIVKEMDNILNASTGGKWDVVKQGYQQDSKDLYAAKAAAKVRSKFVDPETGMLRTTAAAEDTPTVTQAGLRQAIDMARTPDGKLALSPQAISELSGTLDNIKRGDFVRSVKKSATAGGGSDTAANLVAISSQPFLPMWARVTADAVNGISKGRTEAALARLLMDPEFAASKLTEAQRRTLMRSILSDQSLLYRAAPVVAADQ